MAQARGFFEQALALDPGNIEAMVGASAVDTVVGAAFFTVDRAAYLAAAETTVVKVLSHAPNHAFAHLILGVLQISTNRAVQGMAECERALALDRNLAEAHAAIGTAKLAMGRGAETEAHINEAFPGVVDTPIWTKAPTEATGSRTNAPLDPEQIAKSAVPLARACHASEIASGVLYLASDASSYVTGSELVIDGGMFAGSAVRRV